MLATDQLLKRVVNTWLLVAHTRARMVQTQAAQGGIKMILTTTKTTSIAIAILIITINKKNQRNIYIQMYII